MRKILEKFSDVFKGKSLDVDGPFSRFLYRIMKGPDEARIQKNYTSVNNVPPEAINTIRKVVASIQENDSVEYDKEVPNLQTAITGWFMM